MLSSLLRPWAAGAGPDAGTHVSEAPCWEREFPSSTAGSWDPRGHLGERQSPRNWTLPKLHAVPPGSDLASSCHPLTPGLALPLRGAVLRGHPGACAGFAHPAEGPRGSPGPPPCLPTGARPTLRGSHPHRPSAWGCAGQCGGGLVQSPRGFCAVWSGHSGPGTRQPAHWAVDVSAGWCVPSAQPPRPCGEGCSPAPPPATCVLQPGASLLLEAVAAPTHPESGALLPGALLSCLPGYPPAETLLRWLWQVPRARLPLARLALRSRDGASWRGRWSEHGTLQSAFGCSPAGTATSGTSRLVTN